MNAAKLNTLTAPQLANYVRTGRKGAAQFHRQIDVQQTETYKRCSRNFDRLLDALNSGVLSATRGEYGYRCVGVRQTSCMTWQCVMHSNTVKTVDLGDGLTDRIVPAVTVVFDCEQGHVRVIRTERRQNEKVCTLDSGLTFAQIAKCVDAILGE